jgi:hypothetical protein
MPIPPKWQRSGKAATGPKTPVSPDREKGGPPADQPYLRNGKVPPDLATDPQLIDRIVADIATMGLVGEEDAGLLIYSAGSSRKLNKPLSVIIKGVSGSGKDEVQRQPTKLMPPEDVIEATSLTPQSLYYGPEGWLKHKIIQGPERAHQDDEVQRDRTAAIRQLLSQGAITKVTVGPGLEGKTIRQEGPVCYMETTTQDSIFAEDANRCLQVNTDASTALTRKVLLAQAQVYAPGKDQSATAQQEVRERHWVFQRSLNYVDVRIPFSRKLAKHMPATRIEVRRIFGQVLSLIEVIAFLHQHQRPRNAAGQLEATVEDYAVARRLILGPLHASIGLGKDFAKYGPLLDKLPEGVFTTTEAADTMDAKTRKTCLNWLAKLAALGVLQLVCAGEGSAPTTWQRTGKSIDELILPAVDKICVPAFPKGNKGR